MSSSLLIARKACRLQLGAICSQSIVRGLITSGCTMASKDAVARDEKHNQSLVGQGFVTGEQAGAGTTFQQHRGDPELISGSGKDNEDGATPVALGGDYDARYSKPEGEQDFDAVHGHKTDIPWSSGQGSGFDKDWQYEDKN
ncbi:hypothetical protein RvY_12595 [Ramazzottius varieornatus]|uniref:Uncharacterized protein n=1 Tax=Ramazzottius varieornatus TaxID=947166 RepID=A0A1D1VP88_RAMVA|nr:hypothetical protein RvY_12595 [Ramazzottius varieornatus]